MRPGGFYLTRRFRPSYHITRRQGALACDVAELDDLLGPARLRTDDFAQLAHFAAKLTLSSYSVIFRGLPAAAPLVAWTPYGILWASQPCTMFFHTM